MDASKAEFLPAVIGILARLHKTALNRDEPLLAAILAIAQIEAEDALRHAEGVAAMEAKREETSSVTSWRAGATDAAADGIAA